MPAAVLLLSLLCVHLSAALTGDKSQQGLQSTLLGEGTSAPAAADSCAGADEAAEPGGWTTFPSAPGIPGHLLDATLLHALASAAQRTAWQPCSRDGMTVLLEGCQQALPEGGANYQLRAALSCNSHHLNVATVTARVHWPAGNEPQVTVLKAAAEHEPMQGEHGRAAEDGEEGKHEQHQEQR
ncbi:hypothetical protein ABPG77_008766 [Micractinium sp. CCAP 211/92]